MKNINLLKKEKGGRSMKKVTLVVFCLLLAGLLSISTTAQADLINGDLENGTLGQFGTGSIDGWTTWETSGWYAAHYNHTTGGERSAKIWWDDAGMFQDFSATAGIEYDVSAYAFSPSADYLSSGWDGTMTIE